MSPSGQSKRCNHALPYGTADLDPVVYADPGPPRRVRCYVRGCPHFLRPPSKNAKGDCCPVHGIRCHGSAGGRPTYSYADVRRNIIVAQDLSAGRIVGHPFKYESHRLGLENSEDALTWNVFRSLQEAGCLHEIVRWITGQDLADEPQLFLWGISLRDDSCQPWDLLIAARERFESNLPVLRPPTEPDIALFLPGCYLVLIEAKFTSPNPWYTDGPRQASDALTKEELLAIYHDPQLQVLDVAGAQAAERVHYQLWRNTVFAEWMALSDARQTQPYHANLTRAATERESCAEFRNLVRPEYADRFVHIGWEDIYHLCATANPGLARLKEYLETKTAYLRRAFRAGRVQ